MSMNKNHSMPDFLKGLTEWELIAIVEAARVALADAEIAEEIGEKMDMSDADINHLHNKCHEIMRDDSDPMNQLMRKASKPYPTEGE